MGVELYAASGRFHSSGRGRRTWHSFSFGDHYDPANVGLGAIAALNDDHLDPRAGYPDHPHSNLEIVTWVVEGALEHTDSHGRHVVLDSGTVQAQSAGSGIRHSEVAHPDAPRTRFVQVWLRPDEYDATPGLARDVTEGAGLTQVVGGGGLPVGVAGAAVSVGTLDPGEVLEVEPRAHLLVVSGSLALPDQAAAGDEDAVRVTVEGATFTAEESTRLMHVRVP